MNNPIEELATAVAKLLDSARVLLEKTVGSGTEVSEEEIKKIESLTTEVNEVVGRIEAVINPPKPEPSPVSGVVSSMAEVPSTPEGEPRPQ